jgi:hypothetical protein
MSLQAPEPAHKEGLARCQGLLAESVSQQDFYGREKMHYMASQAICEHDYDHLHDSHLDLQDCMRHPIAFLAEMMGDIMYLHKALCQPDAREFVEAVIKEVNGLH